MRKLLTIAAAGCLGIGGLVFAQQFQQAPLARPAETPAPPPNVSNDPLLRGFEFRSIGPAVMMGRVDDIAGSEKDPMIIYIGLRHRRSVEVHRRRQSLEVAVRHMTERIDRRHRRSRRPTRTSSTSARAKPTTARARRSATACGAPRTAARPGRTWVWRTRSRSAASWWTRPIPTSCSWRRSATCSAPNQERGLYKSHRRRQELEEGRSTSTPTPGFTDVAIDPSNPQDRVRVVVPAAAHLVGLQRRRPGLRAVEDAPTAATPGPSWTGRAGRSRRTASTAASRFRFSAPSPPIDLRAGGSRRERAARAAARRPMADRRAADAAAAARRGESATESATPATPAARRGGGAAARCAGGARRSGRIAADAADRPPPPDPNASGVFRSDDGGKTWTFMSNQNQRPTYFSQIRVDPVNDQKMFVGGNPGQMSLDGGKTWRGLTGSHTDYHAFWINPKDPRIVLVGHDGGIDISNDGGVTWDYHNDIAVGQFYQVSADMRRPYCGLRRPAGQQRLVRTERAALQQRAGEHRLVHGRRRRRLLHAPGSDRLGDRVRRIAGRQHDAGTICATARRRASGPTAVADAADAAAHQRLRPRRLRPAALTLRLRQARKARAPDAAASAAARGGGGGRGGPPNVVNAPPNVEPFRFYWNAPIEISPHNPAMIYMAAQYLLQVRPTAATRGG